MTRFHSTVYPIPLLAITVKACNAFSFFSQSLATFQETFVNIGLTSAEWGTRAEEYGASNLKFGLGDRWRSLSEYCREIRPSQIVCRLFSPLDPDVIAISHYTLQAAPLVEEDDVFGAASSVSISTGTGKAVCHRANLV